MSSSQWIGQSGLWTTATLWSAGVPVGAMAAEFGGVDADSVTFDGTGALAGITATDSLVTFDMASGTLAAGDWDWDGGFLQTDGTLSLGGENPVFAGAALQSGGTLILSSAMGFEASFADGLRQTGGLIEITAGVLALRGGSTLAGAIDGSGTLLVGGADAVTFAAGAAIAAGHLDVAAGGVLAFGLNAPAFIVESDLDLAGGAALSAPHGVVTLAGAGTLAGSVTLAELGIEGAYDLGGLSLAGTSAALVSVTGIAALDADPASLGTAGTLAIGPTAGLTLLDPGTLAGGGTAAVTIAGMLDQPGAGTFVLAVPSLALGGVVLIEGALALGGGEADLLGSFAGTGSLDLLAGETGVLADGLLDEAGLAIAAGGTLDVVDENDFAGNLAAGGVIDTGALFTLDPAATGTLGGVLIGGGTLAIEGDIAWAADVLGAALLVTGVAAAAPGATIGTGGRLSVAAAGTLDLTDAGTLTAAALVNDGLLLERGAGALIGTLATAGTLDIAGALTLAGQERLGGLIEGAGTLALAGVATLGAQAQLSVAQLSLAGGTLVLGENLAFGGRLAGTGTIDTDGGVLNLQAGQFAGLLTGGGTLQTGGPVDEGVGNNISLQGSGTTLLDSFAFTLDGAGLVLGGAADQVSLQIAPKATFAITDAATIASGESASALTNAGTLVVMQTDPRAPAAIDVATLINTGTILDEVGALSLAGALIDTGLIVVGDKVTIAGALAGGGMGFQVAGGATLRLGAAVGAGAVIDLYGAGAELALGDAAGFAGTIDNFGPNDALDLLGLAAAGLTYANNTLTLFGTAAGNTVSLANLDAPGLSGPALALVADGAGGVFVLDEPAGHVNAPPGMSEPTAVWNQPESGSAELSSNWLSGATPAAGALLVFPSSANPYEPVFDENFTAYGVTTSTGATLALTGGSLALTNTLMAGTVIVIAGTLDAVSNPAGDEIAVLSLTGLGAVQVDAGALTIGTGLGTLAGTFEGDGAIVLGGIETLGGVDLLAATVALTGITSLAGNLIDFESALFSNTGTLNMGADNLLLGYLTTAALAGRINGTGTLTVAGIGDLGGALSATVVDLGALQGAGTETLTGAISVATGARLVDPVITGTGTLANAGLLIAGAGTQSLALSQFTSTGTITIDDGTLALDAGNGLIGGTLEGAGVLALTGGLTTLAPGLTVLLPTLDLGPAATLSLAGSLSLAAALRDAGGLIEAGALTLGATGNALSGALAGDALLNGGALSGLTLSGTGTALTLQGAASLTGSALSLGAGTDLALLPDATLALAGPVTGAGALSNAGLLLDEGIAPVSLAPVSFDNSGTLAIGADGVITLATAGTLGGTIAGAGTLRLAANGPLTLAAGLSLGGGELGLTGGGFLLGGGQSIAGGFTLDGATLDLGGQALDLTGGASLAGTLAGAGAVTIGGNAVAGALAIASSALSIFITGTLAAAGSLTDHGFIGIAGGGTLDLVASAPLGGAGATIQNDGLLEKTADGLTSTLTAATVVNHGTIDAAFGTIAIAGTLINDGTLIEAGLGGLIAGAIVGAGAAVIDPAGLTVSGAVAAGQTIAFTGPGGTLTLDDPALFAGTIAGTLNGDVIDLPSLNPASLTASTLVNGILTLATGAADVTLALGNAASFSQPLIIGTDGGGGTAVTMACFVTGTAIATPDGPRPVEALAPGDLVITHGGRPAAIVWTGRRRLTLGRGAAAAALRPIRILAGAFGPGRPARDLRLSPNHAIAIDGVLIEAASLVNGATIRREPETPAVTYHHIELAQHSLLLAENLAVESYRDTGSRGDFTHTCGRPAPLQPPCAPLCQGGPRLAAARAHLLARTPDLGFIRTTDTHLTARTATRRLRPLPHPHAYHFALPPTLPRIELLSPAACPADLAAGPADPRTLGAALASVTLQTPTRAIPIDLAHHSHTGLYDCEPTLCWTNGHATLTLPPYQSPALLAVRLAGAVERWEAGFGGL